MKATTRFLPILVAALFPLTTYGEKADCSYDFVAQLNVQVLNRDTQIPVGDLLNIWTGTAWVRSGRLMDFELDGYRVDLRFRGIDEQHYEVSVILQGRHVEANGNAKPEGQSPSPSYEQLNSVPLVFQGNFDAPLMVQPNIGDVTLDLTLYAYSTDT